MVISQKIFSLIFVLMFLCLPYSIKSQDNQIRVDTIFTPTTRVIKIVTVRTIPKFVLEFNASYDAGALELSAHNGGFTANDFIAGKSYCARNGFGFNLTGKLPLGKKGKFWLDVVTGYTKFQSNLIVKNDSDGSVKYNSINGGVGAEYNFTPYHKLNYYIGLNLLISAISGKAENLKEPDSSRINVTINSSLRIGYTLFIGMGYALDKNFGLNLGIRFTHANLLLKQTQEPTNSNTVTILNDYSSDPHITYSGWKQFAYASAYLGMSYYFGVKEKKYKLP